MDPPNLKEESPRVAPPEIQNFEDYTPTRAAEK